MSASFNKVEGEIRRWMPSTRWTIKMEPTQNDKEKKR